MFNTCLFGTTCIVMYVAGPNPQLHHIMLSIIEELTFHDLRLFFSNNTVIFVNITYINILLCYFSTLRNVSRHNTHRIFSIHIIYI